MKWTICLLSLFLSCPLQVCLAYADTVLEAKTAAEKEDQFFVRMLGSRYGSTLPKMELPSFSDRIWVKDPRHSAHAYSHNGDTMKVGQKKPHNRYGTSALVSFIPSGPNPYTGLFSAGAPYGIWRVSLENVPPPGRNAIFIPGIAFKFFIDGKQSVDVLAKPSLNGHKGSNIFAHKFKTNLDEPQPWIYGWTRGVWDKEALRQAGQPTGNPRMLTLDHMAATTSMGAKVKNPIVPFALEFVASPELKSLLDLDKRDFRAALEGNCKGFVLFSVFAVSAENQDPVLIGHIHARSEIMATLFTDETLFFKHSPAFVAPVETIEDF